MIYPMNGGAKRETFAEIYVEYPAGGVCTCSKGAKTLTAGDTSGSWTFYVPSSGYWTLRLSNGTDTVTRVENVTTRGKEYIYLLEYPLYVFKPYEGVPSDWTVNVGGASFADVTKDRIRIGSTGTEGSAYASVTSKSTFDVTYHDTAYIWYEGGASTPNGQILSILKGTQTVASVTLELDGVYMILYIGEIEGEVSVQISSNEHSVETLIQSIYFD